MSTTRSQPPEPVAGEELFELGKLLLPSIVRNSFTRYNHLPNPDDIQRLMQRLLVLLWEDDYRILRDFRQEASLSTYLQKISNTEALHLILESKRTIPIDSLLLEIVDQSQQQEGRLLQKERKQLLEKAMERLSARDQELYNLAYQKELSVEEIAQRLESTPRAVWQRICRLRKRLKKLIRKK
jgi:RNA polymerase sigma-70 factor, ECF subfamily